MSYHLSLVTFALFSSSIMHHSTNDFFFFEEGSNDTLILHKCYIVSRISIKWTDNLRTLIIPTLSSDLRCNVSSLPPLSFYSISFRKALLCIVSLTYALHYSILSMLVCAGIGRLLMHVTMPLTAITFFSID